MPVIPSIAYYPPAKVVLEGDYSDYTVEWVIDDPDNPPTAYLDLMEVVDEYIFIYDNDNSRFLILALSNGSVIANISAYDVGCVPGCISRPVSKSILGKYYAVWTASEGLKIYKNGTLLGTYLTDRAGDFCYVYVSANGQYILVLDISTSPIQWILLKGS